MDLRKLILKYTLLSFFLGERRGYTVLQPAHEQIYFKARELWQILKLEKKLTTAQNTEEWYLNISKDAAFRSKQTFDQG